MVRLARGPSGHAADSDAAAQGGAQRGTRELLRCLRLAREPGGRRNQPVLQRRGFAVLVAGRAMRTERRRIRGKEGGAAALDGLSNGAHFRRAGGNIPPIFAPAVGRRPSRGSRTYTPRTSAARNIPLEFASPVAAWVRFARLAVSRRRYRSASSLRGFAPSLTGLFVT